MARINDFGMPFTSVAGDRSYTSTDWREYFGCLVDNGVVRTKLDGLAVAAQAAPNKTVQVKTGAVFIEGSLRVFETTTNLSLSDNTSGSTRIDRVVARLNLTNRTVELAILQGAPGGSAPGLTRTATIYEMSLAQVTLTNGFSTITSGNIVDERADETVCGFFRSKPEASYNFKATIPATGWSGADPWVNTVSVPGLLATDNPFIDIDFSAAADFAAVSALYQKSAIIYRVETGDDNLTAYALGDIDVNIPIQIKVVR